MKKYLTLEDVIDTVQNYFCLSDEETRKVIGYACNLVHQIDLAERYQLVLDQCVKLNRQNDELRAMLKGEW